jgi:hypothetical protein
VRQSIVGTAFSTTRRLRPAMSACAPIAGRSARSSWRRELDHEHEIAAERVAVGSDPQRLAVLH